MYYKESIHNFQAQECLFHEDRYLIIYQSPRTKYCFHMYTNSEHLFDLVVRKAKLPQRKLNELKSMVKDYHRKHFHISHF